MSPDIMNSPANLDGMPSGTDTLDEIMYRVTHDLKAPIRAMRTLSKWVREDLPPEVLAQHDDVAQHLADMSLQAVRLERMMDDLLAYSRAGSPRGDEEAICLRALVADMVIDLDLQTSFVVRVALAVTHVRVPLHDFAVLLRELIDNAARHHDRTAGTISVTTGMTAQGLSIRVEDDGPGIPERFHDQIFDLMRTLMPRDQVNTSGVGLALVRKALTALDGRITVHSPDGERGACFEIILPPDRAVASSEVGAETTLNPTSLASHQ